MAVRGRWAWAWESLCVSCASDSTIGHLENAGDDFHHAGKTKHLVLLSQLWRIIHSIILIIFRHRVTDLQAACSIYPSAIWTDSSDGKKTDSRPIWSWATGMIWFCGVVWSTAQLMINAVIRLYVEIIMMPILTRWPPTLLLYCTVLSEACHVGMGNGTVSESGDTQIKITLSFQSKHTSCFHF